MRTLPLYAQHETLPVEDVQPRDLDTGCRACSFHETTRHVCLAADGEPGGLLIVGESPTTRDDTSGRPFMSDAGRVVRGIVSDHWKGPVVYDYAVRCCPSQTQRKSAASVKAAITACRPYLAGTLREAAPDRIIVLGPWAAQSVLGRSVSGFQMRRSYAYTEDGVPVFVVLAPGIALRNRFLRGWLEEDLIWAMTAPAPPLPPLRGKVYLVETAEDARQAVLTARSVAWTAVDAETAGLLFTPGFRMLSFSLTPQASVDSFVWTKRGLADTEAREVLLDYLGDRSAKKTGANGKFDVLATHCTGGSLRGIEADVRLWRKLLEPESSGKLADMANLIGMGGHKLEIGVAEAAVLAKVDERLQWERTVERALMAPPLKSGKPRKLKAEPPTLREIGLDEHLEKLARDRESYDVKSWVYALVDEDVLYRYNARDTVSTRLLREYLEPLLDADPGLRRTWDLLLRKASDGIAQVETWGVGVDRDALATFDKYLELQLNGARAHLDSFVKDINWASPPQVREYLFGRLKLPVVKLTDTDQASTDADTLESLRGKHGCIDALLEFRKYDKLRGTYAQGLIPHVRPDGRVHPTFLLDGARSGRASCTEPNVQNIPRADTVAGKMARDMFFAAPGYTFLELDYSQIELRQAAILSGDPVMRQIFLDGHDFHRRTAEMVSDVAWGIPPDQVTGFHRTAAKAVNFGAMYGQGPGALAKKLSQGGTVVTWAAAEAVQQAIFGKFTKLSSYFRTCLAASRKSGVARTMWDGQPARVRPMYKIADPDEAIRATAEHGSWNTPIQGSAADYLTASIGAVVEWILTNSIDAKLCLVVHDSMLLEVRTEILDEVALAVRAIMESWPSDGVPLLVDAKTGKRWGSLTHYDFPAAAA